MILRPGPRTPALAGGALLLLLAGIALTTFPRDTASPARGIPQPDRMRAGAFDPPHAAPGFSLSGSDGGQVTLARYRGKVVLLSFGFTYCATVCPTTLSTLAQARKGLGTAADAVQVIFVTVDPARDSAAHMREYLSAFDHSFIGATGTSDALAATRKQYGVTAEKQGTGADYVMAHTSSIFLIDRAGKLRAMMPFGHQPADFVHDVKLLLAE
jgi:protein SCO1/2